MTSIGLGEPPKFGEVWRDTDGDVTIMWLFARYADGHARGSAVVLESASGYWGEPGHIEEAVSWIFVGWERLDTI